jgi:polyprenyl-phospho-N-acetylgalactosaminyl synthase
MFFAIVPAYNEEQRIGSVVRSLFGHVQKIIVVDDGSVDNTQKNAEEAGAVVVRHEINRGQGAALETGHEYARQNGATHVLHFDGDGQFLVSDITPALVNLKQSGADILFGSRFLDKRSNMPWFKRNILLPAGRFINRLFGTKQLSDAHNGFRILGPRALASINITQDGMAHATEIPALAVEHNLNIVEHPVKVVYHEYGQGITGGFRIVWDLIIGKLVK